MSAPILRDYQREALDAVVDGFLSSTRRRPLVVLPTGSGKTVFFAALLQHPRLAAWLSDFPERARKMLVLAHREELLDQAAAKIAIANPDLFVEVEQADRRATVFADVVVASVQSIVRRLARFDASDYRVVVCDEAHHASAPTYIQVLEHFGVLPIKDQPPTNRDALFVGVTATPKRSDAVGLEHVFDGVAYHRTIRWMIERDYLCPIRALQVQTDTSLDAVATRQGDFAVGQLAETVNTPARNLLIAEAWRRHAEGRKTIAFAVDVDHAHALATAFRETGVRAESVSGETPKDQRADLLARFKRGDVDVISNCMILTEGFDEPSVSCILHARPTKSGLLYQQMTGRGLRPSPGKDDCLILDFADLAGRHSLCTAADLVGLPPQFDLKGKNLLDAKQRIEELQSEYPHLRIDGARSLADLELRAKEIDVWSVQDVAVLASCAYAWAADGELFRLSYPNRDRTLQETVTVAVDLLGKWTATARVKETQGKMTHEHAPTAIGEWGAEAEALRHAEAWVKVNRPDASRLVSKAARWRGDVATPSQLKWLAKKRVPHDPKTITKGEASRLLDIAFSRSPTSRASRVMQTPTPFDANDTPF